MGNLIICTDSSDLIVGLTGFTTTVDYSFASPDTNPHGVTFNGTDIISCDTGNDEITLHDGKTSTEQTQFASPGPYPSGLSSDDTDLFSLERFNDTVYLHDGITTTIQTSYVIAGAGNPRGLLWDGVYTYSGDFTTDYVTQNVGMTTTNEAYVYYGGTVSLMSGLSGDGTDIYMTDSGTQTVWQFSGLTTTEVTSITVAYASNNGAAWDDISARLGSDEPAFIPNITIF
jgi:hypothetical protein